MVHLLGLAEAFARSGRRTVVLVPRPRGVPAWRPEGVELRLSPRLPGSAPFGLHVLGMLWPFWRTLRQGAAACVVRNGSLSVALTMLARLAGVPVIGEHNGWAQDEARHSGRPAAVARTLARTQEWDARCADVVRAVTPGLAARLVESGVRPSRVTVIPNGTDTRRFRPLPRAHVLAELGLREDRLYAGFIGHLTAWQGLPTAIEALALLVEAWPTLDLLVAGDGPEEPALRALAVRCGVADRVVFLGAVPFDRANVVVNAFDVALAPFTRERNVRIGLSPLKIRDYAAAGRPVLASAVPGVEELAAHGWLVCHRPDDAAELAARLGDLLARPDTRGGMGQRARAYAEEHFDWAAVRDRVVAALAVAA